MKARLALVPVLVALGLALAPVSASAQLIFDRGNDLYAASDDGSNAHRLVAASWLGMDHGLGSPSVAPHGDVLLFRGTTFRNAAHYQGYTTYGSNADGVYALTGGRVTRLSKPPAPATDSNGNHSYTSGDEEPEPAPGGGYVYQHIQCSVYFNSGFGVWADDCGTQLESTSVSRGTGGASDFPSDCGAETVTPGTVRNPSPDPAAAGLRVAYAGCVNSPSNLLVDAQNELIVSGPGRQRKVVVALGADAPGGFNNGYPGFFDPSWSVDGSKLVAYASGGYHTSDATGTLQSTSVPGGLYVFGDLSHTTDLSQGTAGTLVLKAPADGSGGYLKFSSPRFMGTHKIVFVARGSVWSIPADCSQCSFPADATRLYNGGSSSSTRAYSVTWTSRAIASGSPPSPAVSVRTGRAKVTAGRTKVRLACRGSVCRGTLRLTVKQRVHRRVHGQYGVVTKTIVVAYARYSLPGDSTRQMSLRLRRAAQKLLARARHRNLRVQARTTVSGGKTTRRTIVLWLKAAHRKR